MDDDKKDLPIKRDEKTSVRLHESGPNAGSLIDQSLSRLTQEQAQAFYAKAAEQALILEVKRREQNMDYVLGKKVVEDHIDAWMALDKSGKLTRHSVVTDAKTGAGNMRIESKSGATCFVATVAYGDPDHPDVAFLRDFRDNVLAESTFGRRLIDWYWRTGPKIAEIVVRSRSLCLVSKAIIATIVRTVRATPFGSRYAARKRRSQ